MSTDLPLLTDMKPRLVTTLAGNPGGRVMQSFTRAPWTDEYYVAYVDSVVSGGPSNLRIARCDSSGAMLDYAVLQGGGHGASITAEYESGKVWIWLFWGSDVGYGTGTAVRWAYNGTPNGATVLLADAQTVPDPGAGDPGHVNGYFAIDQAKDRLATKFSSGTTETYTLWKLSDYKAGTGSPLFTAPTTWPTGDLSAFQGFTTSDKALYITRGGSSVTDQAPTLYQLDWATGAITASMDISQLAATTSAGADGGHNEAEGVCLWRDSGGNPELLFGIDTGPTSNRSGLIFRLAAPVDGTATKTVQIDAENVTGEAATNVVASFRYDRTVTFTTGGFTPTAYEQPVKLSESSTVELKVSDHPDLTDDSFGFVIYVTLTWDDLANPGRRKPATYTAQLSATDPAVVTLSSRLVATGAVPAGQIIGGKPGHSPVVTMVGDQVTVDGVTQGPHLTGAPGGSDTATASWITSGTQTKTALDTLMGGDFTDLVKRVRELTFNVKAAPYNANGTTSGNATTESAAIQSAMTDALAAGGYVFFPPGCYNVNTTLTVDLRGITGLTTSTRRRVGIVGSGKGNTLIRATADDVTILQVLGQSPLSTDSNAFMTIRDLCFGGQTPTARTATGVLLQNLNALNMATCSFIGLGQAIVLDGTLSSKFDDITIVYNTNGVQAKSSTATAPNSNTWVGCEFGSNTGIAYDGQNRVAGGTFVNCRFEGNGTAGSGQPIFHQVSDGAGGEGALTFINCYTERNNGSADFLFEGPTTGTRRVAFTFIGGNYTRSTTPAVTNNIITTGQVDLTAGGAAFCHYTGYTPAAATKVMALSSSTRFNDLGNRYADAIEAPSATLNPPISTRGGWNVLSGMPLALTAAQGGVVGAGVWRFARFTIAAPLTIKGLGAEVFAAATGGTSAIQFAIYAADAAGGGPGTLLKDLAGQGTLDLTSTGVKTMSLSTPVALGSGTYWIGGMWSGTATTGPNLYVNNGVDLAVLGTSGPARNLNGYTQTTSSVPNPAAATTPTSAWTFYYQQ